MVGQGGLGMKISIPMLALYLVSGACLAGAQHALGQEAVTFTCLAPSGHICQFGVRTGGGQLNFALASGEKKEMPGLTPRADTYCVCDPGPVARDCKQPRPDLWCLGSWQLVQPGVNSENSVGKVLLANARIGRDD
jgi:hypothetical protein